MSSRFCLGLSSEARGKQLQNQAPCSTPRGERVASMCRGAPRPNTSERHGAEGLANAPRACAAGAEPRAGPPVLHGRTEYGEHPPFATPEHRATCLAVSGTVLALEPYSHWKQAREQRTEGSPPSGAKDRAATLYSVGPTREPDHEAAIRFGGEAPRRRAHSNERLNDHVLARVTATSDRDRPAVQDSVCRARRNSVPAFLVVVSVRRVVAAQHRAGPRRW